MEWEYDNEQKIKQRIIYELWKWSTGEDAVQIR